MWIDVNNQMPLLGRRVPVRGNHTPDGWGYPRAYLMKMNGRLIWMSNEWRGTVAIQFWLDEEGKTA